jgi:hypothetical protein
MVRFSWTKKTKPGTLLSSLPAVSSVAESSINSSSNAQLFSAIPSTEARSATTDSSLPDESSDKYGLFPLYAPTIDSVQSYPATEETNELDIVAVHGLNGDYYKTWTHDNKLWLRDFIPKDLPGVRVFSYGYPSDLFFTLNKGSLGSYAGTLLETLKGERRKIKVCIF